jgi:polar amino acid transport system substrate-binding protein
MSLPKWWKWPVKVALRDSFCQENIASKPKIKRFQSAIVKNFRWWQRENTRNLTSKILILKSKIFQLFGLGLCVSLIATQILASFSFPGYAAELSEILERGSLVVAVKDNLPPLGFRSADGTLQGLEIDLARRLAEELLGDSNAVELKPVSNVNRLSVVFDHEVDLAIAGVTANRVRSRIVSFSPPYYLDGTGLVSKRIVRGTGNLAATVAGRKIAVLNGSSTIAVVRYYLPTAQLVGVNSYQEAYSLLEADEAIAFAADASVLAGWVQEYPEYSFFPVQLGTQPLAVVMPKGQQYSRLRQKVNQAIAIAQADGWLLERTQYWGLPVSSSQEK